MLRYRQTKLEVVTGPDVTRLCDPAVVAAAIGETDLEKVGGYCDVATSIIEEFCGRTFARRTLRQTFFIKQNCGEENPISLDTVPVDSVVSVIENDETLAAMDYELSGVDGFLFRIDSESGYRVPWPTGIIKIEFVCGFLLPGQNGVNLPFAVRNAAETIAATQLMSVGRDYTLRSKTIEGVGSRSYRDPGNGGSAIPAEIEGTLIPFKLSIVRR